MHETSTEDEHEDDSKFRNLVNSKLEHENISLA